MLERAIQLATIQGALRSCGGRSARASIVAGRQHYSRRVTGRGRRASFESSPWDSLATKGFPPGLWAQGEPAPLPSRINPKRVSHGNTADMNCSAFKAIL
eukprot:364385-Chlamydomonas_euryale.AAC.10